MNESEQEQAGQVADAMADYANRVVKKELGPLWELLGRLTSRIDELERGAK